MSTWMAWWGRVGVMLRWIVVGFCVVLSGVVALRSAPPASGASVALFQSDGRQILTQNCVKCHGGEKTKGEFDLTTREGWLHPGAEGVNVVPGDSAKSRLMKLIRHETDPTMPSKAEPLPQEA